MPVRPAGRRRRTRARRVAAALLAGVATPFPAAVEEWRTLQLTAYCRGHAEFAAALAERHGETRWWWGINNEGTAVVELYGSAATGSWTLLRVDPDGRACALGGGTSGARESGEDGESP